MTMTQSEYATGLRRLANFYEGHPEVPIPRHGELGEIDFSIASKSELVAVLRGFGGHWERSQGSHSGLVYFTQSFGSFTLRAYVDQARVCTPRVVGQRVIPAQPATEERVEDVVEWECGSVLGEQP